MARLIVAADETQLATLAADRLAALIGGACAGHGRASVCLTGGSTPRRTYERLADTTRSRDIDWARVDMFWGDERHVPPEHRDSNFGMAKRALLDRIPIPARNVHRIRAEMPDARAAAADYDRTLERAASAAAPGPLFDVMLLGLGEDAHIASLFPGGDWRRQPKVGPRAAAVWAPHLDTWRITLMPETILDSAAIVMLVAGAAKADAVYAAIEAPVDVQSYPAQLLRPADDRVEWLLDRAAAARLSV